MAQRQVDIANCDTGEFSEVFWDDHEVNCQLNERFSLVVKRANRLTYVLLRSGSKFIKLPFEVFNTMCDSQITIIFLKDTLKSKEEDHEWLCIYCGRHFSTVINGSRHEQQHKVISDS